VLATCSGGDPAWSQRTSSDAAAAAAAVAKDTDTWHELPPDIPVSVMRSNQSQQQQQQQWQQQQTQQTQQTRERELRLWAAELAEQQQRCARYFHL
jgi:hypothetical protein